MFEMETFLATLCVLAVPIVTEMFEMPGGFIGALVLPNIIYFVAIVLITMLTNISRAIRLCKRGKKEWKEGLWGIKYGARKGLVVASVATLGSFIVNKIPFLKIPFMLLSFIPYVGTMINGIILSFFYLFGYVAIAHPIWGYC